MIAYAALLGGSQHRRVFSWQNALPPELIFPSPHCARSPHYVPTGVTRESILPADRPSVRKERYRLALRKQSVRPHKGAAEIGIYLADGANPSEEDIHLALRQLIDLALRTETGGKLGVKSIPSPLTAVEALAMIDFLNRKLGKFTTRWQEWAIRMSWDKIVAWAIQLGWHDGNNQEESNEQR